MAPWVHPSPQPKTAPRLDQLFLYSILSLYFTMGRAGHVPPKLPRPLGGSGPHLTRGSLGHPSPQYKQHLDWIRRFSPYTLQWGRWGMSPQIASSLGDRGSYPIYGSTQVHNPNGISIGSSVFVWLTIVSNIQTHTQIGRDNATPIATGHILCLA